jgi:hypothetical protein
MCAERDHEDKRRGAAAKRTGAKGTCAVRTAITRAETGGRKRPENTVGDPSCSGRAWQRKMKLRDLNLHLQGLYAELGKSAYELRGRSRAR